MLWVPLLLVIKRAKRLLQLFLPLVSDLFLIVWNNTYYASQYESCTTDIICEAFIWLEKWMQGESVFPIIPVFFLTENPSQLFLLPLGEKKSTGSCIFSLEGNKLLVGGTYSCRRLHPYGDDSLLWTHCICECRANHRGNKVSIQRFAIPSSPFLHVCCFPP